jgi:formylglycine-generating enzyme required for sulfatase activity
MGYSGTDSFSYTVSDGKGGTDLGLVTVTVTLPTLPGTWIPITAGTYSMGCSLGDACCNGNEDPHSVMLTHNFRIQSTEVTEEQFQTVMGYNPTIGGGCNNCPVQNVTWHMAVAYCNGLNSTGQQQFDSCYSCSGSGDAIRCQEAPAYSGQNIYACPGYRLPTEAEWEYAYRAGSTTAIYTGGLSSCNLDATADTISWNFWNSGYARQPVQGRTPNIWGLHDMAGNILEWCHDVYQASLGGESVTNPVGPAPTPGINRVYRGGHFGNYVNYIRASWRASENPDYRYNYLGFRCVRVTSQ